MKKYPAEECDPVKRAGYTARYLADIEFPEPVDSAGFVFVRIPAGGRTRSHTHYHLDEMFVAMTPLRVGVGTELHEAKVGDVFLIERGELHWFEAPASTDALLMAIKVPNLKEDKVDSEVPRTDS